MTRSIRSIAAVDCRGIRGLLLAVIGSAAVLPAAVSPAAVQPRTELAQTQQQWPPPAPGGAPPRAGPPTSYLPSPQTGPFEDAFGRFRAVLPEGAEQVNATYAFELPAGGLQISISVATRDAMFQESLQSFPEMMKQSGAPNVGQQTFEHRGRQATIVLARLRDTQGAAMQSLNVFVPGPNLWLQVNGPEAAGQQIEQTMQSLLRGLQHR